MKKTYKLSSTLGSAGTFPVPTADLATWLFVLALSSRTHRGNSMPPTHLQAVSWRIKLAAAGSDIAWAHGRRQHPLPGMGQLQVSEGFLDLCRFLVEMDKQEWMACHLPVVCPLQTT